MATVETGPEATPGRSSSLTRRERIVQEIIGTETTFVAFQR
jgi:hypothetical protein